ncbi:MAG: hypothetical protein ACTSP2_04525 [Alphaproteobacteria bacterium]
MFDYPHVRTIYVRGHFARRGSELIHVESHFRRAGRRAKLTFSASPDQWDLPFKL